MNNKEERTMPDIIVWNGPNCSKACGFLETVNGKPYCTIFERTEPLKLIDDKPVTLTYCRLICIGKLSVALEKNAKKMNDLHVSAARITKKLRELKDMMGEKK